MFVKKILEIVIPIALIIAVIIIIFGFRGNANSGNSVDEIIGIGLKYKVYDEFNKLSAEVTSSSSIRDFDKSRIPSQRERILLKDIKGIIYKKGEFKSDVRFSSKSGYVENGYKNFLLKDDAKIESKEASLYSDHFFMEGNSLISNDTPTKFKLKNMEGIAKRGINHHLNFGVTNFLEASGIYKRSGKKYHFKCKTLMVFKKINRIVFNGKVHLESDDSIMKGEEIVMHFNEDFKNLIKSDIVGNGYFYARGKRKGEFREMRGKLITAELHKGTINKIDIVDDGTLILNRNKNKLIAESNLIHLIFKENAGKLNILKLMKKGVITATGRRSFSLSAFRIRIKFDDKGDIDYCYNQGGSKFKIREFRTDSMLSTYYPKKEMISIAGENSTLEKGKDRFVSSKFTVDLDKKKLFSKDKISSTLYLKNENSIFSKSPVFISSKRVEINDKTGIVIYEDDVKLFQGETTLNAGKIEVGGNTEVSISKGTVLNFKNGEEEIIIRGEELYIDPETNSLNISGKGSISDKENTLSGESIVVEFDKNKLITMISGTDNIEFKRKSISGESDKVIWMFAKKVITFMTNAKLVKDSSGQFSGEEIRFFLKDERVEMRSSDGKRIETKID